MNHSPSVGVQKNEARKAALARRRSQPEKTKTSERILDRFFSLAAFATADTVMMYVHAYSEVRTSSALTKLWNEAKQLVVPYCVDGSLELFRLESIEELAPGAFNILEPREQLRELPHKRVSPSEVDLLAIPGVAFDREGTRLGYGHGHFDRLLPQCRDDALKVALAFECQIVDNLPQGEHDVPMDAILTEGWCYG